MTGPVTFLARGLLAGVFINGGISQFKGARLLAPKVEAAKEEYGVVTEVAGEDLVRLNGAGMVLAGGALLVVRKRHRAQGSGRHTAANAGK